MGSGPIVKGKQTSPVYGGGFFCYSPFLIAPNLHWQSVLSSTVGGFHGTTDKVPAGPWPTESIPELPIWVALVFWSHNRSCYKHYRSGLLMFAWRERICWVIGWVQVIAKAFSKVVLLICTPTSSSWQLSLHSGDTNTWHFPNFKVSPLVLTRTMYHCGFNLQLSDIEWGRTLSNFL